MPFQEILLVLLVLAVSLGWLAGGGPEREGVVVLIVGSFVSNLLFHVRLGNFSLGDSLGDLICLTGFGWLAFKRDRWWLLTVFALQILVMLIHLMVLTTGTISVRADISARWGLLALTLLLMMAGVIERRLAGEAPISPGRRWLPGCATRRPEQPLDDLDRTA